MRLAYLAFLSLALAAGGCKATSGGTPEDAGTPENDAGPLDPCAAADLDGDGYFTDPSCGPLDCDDENPSVHPGAAEACNGEDEDCDEEVDEDLGEGACGMGACRRTVPFCVDGRPTACTPAAGGPEVCNGEDDNCNGDTDEGLMGEACGVGACARNATCSGGQWLPCQPGAPSTELCNRVDDDCNGTVDEGFRIRVWNGTYSALAAHHPSCDGAGQRIGPDCNAAMHRYCAQDGCTTSGFGPLENSGDISIVGCVAAEPTRDVPYAELATHHGPCDGTQERIGPNCNAAIHRYCASQGFVSGFGPVEMSAASAGVTCMRAGTAEVVITSYTTLSGQHGGCRADTRIGPDCNAAINRFCASSGFRTGYGPVENIGDTAVVTCLRP